MIELNIEMYGHSALFNSDLRSGNGWNKFNLLFSILQALKNSFYRHRRSNLICGTTWRSLWVWKYCRYWPRHPQIDAHPSVLQLLSAAVRPTQKALQNYRLSSEIWLNTKQYAETRIKFYAINIWCKRFYIRSTIKEYDTK